MTNNDKHILSDEELDAYLDGRHEVSAAHQGMDKTSSPPELDEKILARARDSVADSVQSKGDIDRFYRPYAVAATVFLCVTIAFMLRNEPPPSGPAALNESSAGLRPSAQRVVEEEVADQSLESQVQQERSEPEAFQTQAAQAPAAPTSNAASIEPGAVVRARNGDVVAEIGASNELQNQTAESQDAAGLAVAADEDTPERRAEEFTAREAPIAITGQEVPTYRNERQTWLAEIQRLREAGNDGAAEAEAQLFLARYPGTNLEQALEDLPSQ